MIIDLSRPVAFNKNDPFFMRVKIKHKPHWIARWLVRLLGLPFRNMPKDFTGWADDTMTHMGVHAVTHIDAPWHYGPLSGGQRAQTIDEMPLEACIGSARAWCWTCRIKPKARRSPLPISRRNWPVLVPASAPGAKVQSW